MNRYPPAGSPAQSSASASASAALRRVRPRSRLLLQPGVLCTELAATASIPRTSSHGTSSSTTSTPSRPSASSTPSASSRPSATSSPDLFLDTSSTWLAALSSPTTEDPSHVTPIATMDELGDPLTTDELGDPMDIPVDVIHRFARAEDFRWGGGFMGRADAVVPERTRRGDGLDDTVDLVQAYSETGFNDDGIYDTTACFPKKLFFVVSIIVLLLAFVIIRTISYIRFLTSSYDGTN